MTRLTLDLNLEGAAFQPEPEPEVARLLRELAAAVEARGLHQRHIPDANGNTCGSVWIDPAGPYRPEQP